MKLHKNEYTLFKTERESYKNLLEEIQHSHVEHSSQLSLTCIGNAGGADAVSRGYPTGGLMVRCQDKVIIVDPGENSLSFLAGTGFNTYSVTDVVATHAHNDHVGDLSSFASSALQLNMGKSSDANILVPPTLIDYRNSDSTRFGFTLPAYAWGGNVTALHWNDTECTRYDGKKIKSVPSATIGKDIKITSIPGRHGGMPAGGLVFDTPNGRFGYTADTEYFDELAAYYENSDVLWINMSTLGLGSSSDASEIVPENPAAITNHLGYCGVCKLISQVRPRTAIVSHFGSHLLTKVGRIESLLRKRFQDSDIKIYCTHNGDEYRFARLFSDPAQLTYIRK